MKKNILFMLVVAGSLCFGSLNYGQTTVVMNEIYARGTTSDPDWIEIYNPNSTTVDISGYKIYDIGGQGGTKPKKAFPSGTVVPAKGFFVIATDVADSAGFGLSGSGEKVWLENAAGTIIDTVTFGATATADQSYGRTPDGGTWGVLPAISKGKSNSTTPLSTVVMNEIFARGTTSDPDWIELYNPLSASVDISGYKIYDNGGQGGTKPKKVFPSGTVIPSKGFYVIVTDVTDADGFGLSGSGEWVWLENASGKVIDSVNFGATAAATESYGRTPDGGTWGILSAVTKGKTNNTTGITRNSAAVSEYRLEQNYPNPFNPATVINYTIPSAAQVRLSVYNVLGKEVASLFNGYQAAGNYSVSFSASEYNLSGGIYFYQLNAGKYSITKKMILSK